MKGSTRQTGLALISDRIARIEEQIAALLVALMLLLVTLQVAARQAGWPLVWSEEASIFLFTSVTLIGGSAATARRVHVRLALLAEKLPVWLVRALDWLMAFTLLALIPGSLRCAEAVARLSFKSPAMGLPMQWIYGLAPLALLLMALHLAAPGVPREDEVTEDAVA